jgi:hypothetical protein
MIITPELKKNIQKVARAEFKIPKRRYISVFPIAFNTFIITYNINEVEHKHVLHM